MAVLFRSKLLFSKCFSYPDLFPKLISASSRGARLVTTLLSPDLHLKPQSLCVTVQRRCSSGSSDHLEPGHEKGSTVVYSGSLRSTLKLVKSFSLTTSFVGILLQPVLLQKLLDKPVGVALTVVATTSFFIVATPMLLHFVARRYVTELTFNPSTQMFEATTLTLLNRQKKMSFSAEDVEVPDIPGAFTTFLARGRPLFVDPRLFQDVDALEHLMGYDKPMDWHLQQQHQRSSEQSTPKPAKKT